MKISQFISMSCILTVLLYLGACGSSDPGSSATEAEDTTDASAKGKEVYQQYCVLCHGSDGKLAINGAKDITVSQLTLEERITLISEGKGLMTPYEGVLSQDKIEAVAAYSMTLK